MENDLMTLKILLPFKVFMETKNVKRIVMETSAGSYGLLPQRLDCTAALRPGILLYETLNDVEKYIAIDEGVMIKSGAEVLVSVRNAIGNARGIEARRGTAHDGLAGLDIEHDCCGDPFLLQPHENRLLKIGVDRQRHIVAVHGFDRLKCAHAATPRIDLDFFGAA